MLLPIPAEQDPTQLLLRRVDELGALQAQVSAAVSNLAAVERTKENLDYNHDAAGINADFIMRVTTALAPVTTTVRSGENAPYNRGSYYERYIYGFDATIQLPDAASIPVAAHNIIWSQISKKGLAQLAPHRTRLEEQSPDLHGRKQPKIMVMSTFSTHSPNAVHDDRLPFYVVGARPGNERFTSLLLAMPALDNEFLPVSSGLFTTEVNSRRWAQIEQEDDKLLIPTEAMTADFYNAATDVYEISARTNGALVSREDDRTFWSNRPKGLSRTRRVGKAARLPFTVELPKGPHNKIEPWVFDEFGVMERLIRLSVAFGKTASFKELLTDRAAKLPTHPFDQLPGIKDYASVVEAGEAFPQLDRQIDRLHRHSPVH